MEDILGLLEATGKIFGIDFLNEPYITLIGAVALIGLMVWLIKFTMEMLSGGVAFIMDVKNWLFFILLFVVLFIGFGYIKIAKSSKVLSDADINSTALKVLKFKPNKAVYNVTDNQISFTIQANKDAYYYLHTQNAKTGEMIILPVGVDNKMKKNEEIDLGYYCIEHYVGNERIELILTSKPYEKFEQNMTKTSYTKELAYLGGLPKHRKKEEIIEVAQRELSLKVNNSEAYDRLQNACSPQIIINTESNKYSLGEEIDFNIETNRDGYVTVFEATPLLNITRKKSNITSSNELKSFTQAAMPLGEHIGIAIYTKSNEHILATDFVVKSEDTKGGVEYRLDFHNGKQYVYDIVQYSIQP